MTTILSSSSLNDMIERGTNVRNQSAQFERDIWAIKADAYRQLAETIANNESNLDGELLQAAQAYAKDYKNHGILLPFVQELFAAATSALCSNTSDIVIELIHRTGHIIDMEKLWNKGVALFNRSGGFYYLPSQGNTFVAVLSVMEQWAVDHGVGLPPVPESPYYFPTTVIMREGWLDALVARGAKIATDAAQYEQYALAIKSVSDAQVASGVKGAASRATEIDALAIQATEYNKRAAKVADMKNHPTYKGLDEAYSQWLETEGK